MNNANYTKVFSGTPWETDILLGLLKSNGVSSAIKLERTDSNYKSIFGNLDEIFVHREEVMLALKIIKDKQQ